MNHSRVSGNRHVPEGIGEQVGDFTTFVAPLDAKVQMQTLFESGVNSELGPVLLHLRHGSALSCQRWQLLLATRCRSTNVLLFVSPAPWVPHKIYKMVNGLHLYSAFIQSAVQFKPLIHTQTAIGCHARYQPARQERLGARRLAQGHFDTPRVGSNRQPSDCQTTVCYIAIPPELYRHTISYFFLPQRTSQSPEECIFLALRSDIAF